MKPSFPASSIQRILITGLLILIQLVWFVLFFTKLAAVASWINILFIVLSFLIVLQLVNKEENPAYKIGWIILIELLPILGGAMYLFFGNQRPSARMRAQFKRNEATFAHLLNENAEPPVGLSPRMRGTAHYVADTGGFPIWQNTDVRYYRVGEEMYADMLEALEKAEHFIFLEYFIIMESSEMWQSILQILERKAAQGVDVRLMYDDLGSVALLPADYREIMEKKGIRCLAFNPFVPFLSLVMNHRDHRKILCIDGHTAFNGGINLSDEYINRTHPHGHWKDTGVRLIGDAAWNFTIMFLQMWEAFRPGEQDFQRFLPHAFHPDSFLSNGWAQPFGDSPLDNEPLSENIYIDILSQAQDYVYINTPYLAISNEMQTALTTAAKRGVDVRIVTPGIPDKRVVYALTRSYYPPLLQAGVKIYEYTPGFIHAKSYLSDDRIGVVGTINMDYRSLYLHFECGTLLYECDALSDLKADCEDIFSVSREVLLSDCRRDFPHRLFQAVLRVFAPLF